MNISINNKDLRENNSSQQITTLRTDLQGVTHDLIQLIIQRKKLTYEIQKLKPQIKKYPFYDPVQETKVFHQLELILTHFCLRELLSFSILIEAHALGPSGTGYPRWSEQEHLCMRLKNENDEKKGINHMNLINPLLLREFDHDLFQKLPLKNEFLFLKNL